MVWPPQIYKTFSRDPSLSTTVNIYHVVTKYMYKYLKEHVFYKFRPKLNTQDTATFRLATFLLTQQVLRVMYFLHVILRKIITCYGYLLEKDLIWVARRKTIIGMWSFKGAFTLATFIAISGCERVNQSQMFGWGSMHSAHSLLMDSFTSIRRRKSH